jgi:hypothetical protein
LILPIFGYRFSLAHLGEKYFGIITSVAGALPVKMSNGPSKDVLFQIAHTAGLPNHAAVKVS